ncbi:proton-coupled amino acid transporter 3-like [Dendronephthya gigantea]|uniref:proton-coupled amino acid transporter 3-like n=1 Tax=Dendronephthya gigantea TaxID=151771 RepID=UPI00106AF0D3|nr:proton-coupled amino acid transporter 3-like [Dendronephthya gigantea]XP_028401801.1 proton-coupled amino acid transporter 3-like [Dendronephthya gigantea]
MSRRAELSSEEFQELFGKNECDSNTSETDEEIIEKQEGPHFISTFQGTMMLARFCVGSGLFSIPAAFKYSGIMGGIIWVFINGFLTAYGMRKLTKLSSEITRRSGSISVYYGDLGEECAKEISSENGGKVGRVVVNIAIVISCFCLVCTQFIYIAAIWQQGFEKIGIPQMNISSWILVVYCVLFPLFQIRRPDTLATCSLLANVLTVVGTVTVFVHIFSARTFQTYRQENKVFWTKLPLTIGITSYAYQLMAPLIVTMRSSMKEPSKVHFVINIVLACVTVLYAVMGAAGYASCHPDCADSILLNLPGSRYASIVKIFLGLASCIGTVLGMFVCFNVVEPILGHYFPESCMLFTSTTTRIFFLTFAAGITAAVPELTNVMSLAGSFTNPVFGFIFPAFGHIALFRRTLSRVDLAKDIALLFCGLFILFIGFYTSLYMIVLDLEYPSYPS